jgi:serine/threonine protein kinase
LASSSQESAFGDLPPRLQSSRTATLESDSCDATPVTRRSRTTRWHSEQAGQAGKEAAEQFEGSVESETLSYPASSALLARRRSTGSKEKTNLMIQVRPSTTAIHTALARHNSSPTLSAQRQIRHLGENEKIFDLYFWDEVLQEEGNGGKVVVCHPKDKLNRPGDAATVPAETKQQGSTQRQGGEGLVMKIRSKESLRQQRIEEQFRKSQIKLLNLPPHPGVLPIYEVLEDDKFFYILMPRAIGSFLEGLVSEFEDGVMPEGAVRTRMREIIEAVGHVHSQGMLHRDVKPDNQVMVQVPPEDQERSGKSPTKRVALIDFDHAEPEFEPSTVTQQFNSFFGTIRYSAPEAFSGCFSQTTDLYSIGVILYLLMTGKMPYNEDTYSAYYSSRECEEAIEGRSPKTARSPKSPWSGPDKEAQSPTSPGPRFNWRAAIYQRIMESQIDWCCNPWPEQPTCKALCQRLLAIDPKDRFESAEAVLSHSWFRAK